MQVRRVVTGHKENGLATIVSDGYVEKTSTDGVGGLFRIWSADEPAAYPDRGVDPGVAEMEPPVGGLRLFVFTLDPPPLGAASSKPEVDDIGLHQAFTTDFEVVLSGEATVETADGSKVTLRRGDTIVHNGAAHRWSNNGPEPAVLAGCMVGAFKR